MCRPTSPHRISARSTIRFSDRLGSSSARREPEVRAAGPPRLALGSFSPDGRWLAYVSGETGRPEVYVDSFPTLGNRQMVSREGGFYPRWSPSGQELFFFEGFWELPGRMMIARRAKEASSTWQNPSPLFQVPSFFTFAVARTGRPRSISPGESGD